MKNQTAAQSVLDDFANAIDLPGLELDASGRATITIGAMQLSFVYESDPIDALWMFVDLGPAGEDEDCLKFVLTLAFTSWVADTMTIAMDKASGHLMGYKAMPIELLKPEVVQNAFDRLVGAALTLRERLEAQDYSGLDVLESAEIEAGSAADIRV